MSASQILSPDLTSASLVVPTALALNSPEFPQKGLLWCTAENPAQLEPGLPQGLSCVKCLVSSYLFAGHRGAGLPLPCTATQGAFLKLKTDHHLNLCGSSLAPQDKVHDLKLADEAVSICTSAAGQAHVLLNILPSHSSSVQEGPSPMCCSPLHPSTGNLQVFAKKTALKAINDLRNHRA